MCSWVLIKLTVSRQMPSPIISSVETADWIPDLVRICLPGTSKGPGIMVCLKLCRTALIGTRLRRTVGLTGELELTVIALAVGEVGVVGVPAVRQGKGKQTRTRQCEGQGNGGTVCPGSDRKYRSCEAGFCPYYGSSSSSSSSSCSLSSSSSCSSLLTL